MATTNQQQQHPPPAQTLVDTTSPSSNPSAAPSSSITPTHFQHRTTTAAPVNPLIDTSTPALNTVPIELDSTPVTSPVVGQPRKGSGAGWNIKEAIAGAVAEAEKKVHEGFAKASSSSKHHSEGEGASSSSTTAALGAADKLRPDSAAVMAGPPGTPGPEDFEAAKVDAAVTPS